MTTARDDLSNKSPSTDAASFKRGLQSTRGFWSRHYSTMPNGKDYSDLITNGQDPGVLFITCIDSRLLLSNIFGLKEGEAIIKSNVGGMAPPYVPVIHPQAVPATLAFTTKLHVKHIILLGHSHCGGIEQLVTYIKQDDQDEHHHAALASEADVAIKNWIGIAEPAVKKALANTQGLSIPEIKKACEEQALTLSLSNLLTYPWIKEKVAKGELQLHAWRYNLATARLQVYHPGNARFEDIPDVALDQAAQSQANNKTIRSKL